MDRGFHDAGLALPGVMANVCCGTLEEVPRPHMQLSTLDWSTGAMMECLSGVSCGGAPRGVAGMADPDRSTYKPAMMIARAGSERCAEREWALLVTHETSCKDLRRSGSMEGIQGDPSTLCVMFCIALWPWLPALPACVSRVGGGGGGTRVSSGVRTINACPLPGAAHCSSDWL